MPRIAGVLATIAAVFGNNGVSIAQLIPKNAQDGFADCRHDRSVKECCMKDAMAVLNGMSTIQKISSVIKGTVRTNYEKRRF